MRVPVGQWLPDQPALGNPGSTLARNCLAQLNSFTSLASLEEFGTALDDICVGTIWAKNAAGDVFTFAGDATKLYLLVNNVWTDVSKPGGYTAVEDWQFAKFGDRMVAVTAGVQAQYFDMGTSATFLDLPNAPEAQTVATVRDFLVMGNVTDADGTSPSRIRWSGFNNTEIWGSSLATQDDFQDIPGRGGIVQKVVPGEVGYVFQEHAIHRMNYTGPPTTFRFDEISNGKGTPAPNSVVWTDNRVFYLGHDGFHVLDESGPSRPIGSERVDNWFLGQIATGTLDKVRGVVVRAAHYVAWTFRTSASLDYNNRVIIYNYGADRWSYADIATQVVGEYESEAQTLDTIGTFLGGTIDTTPINVDSPAYQGGQLSLLAFTPNNKAATLAGPPLNAEIETAAYVDEGGRVMRYDEVFPLVEGTPATSVTVQSIVRRQQTENPVYGSPVAPRPSGWCKFRANGRSHRFRINISGGFNHVTGVLVEPRIEGMR